MVYHGGLLLSALEMIDYLLIKYLLKKLMAYFHGAGLLVEMIS